MTRPSFPEAGQGRGDEALAKGNTSIMVIEHGAECEPGSRGFSELAQPGEILVANGRRRFDLESDDPSLPILKDDVDLVLVP